MTYDAESNKVVAGGTIAIVALIAGVYSAPSLLSKKESMKTASFIQSQENGKTVKQFEITVKTADHELKDGVCRNK
ncbi:hypothetical protein ACFO8Q_06890 [Effusibacillus consociatus]|uniref:Uncharacterized protein n=1 Tax=Effusibacillus consociatus TaxID=1117041 RepID=A0ABV9PZE6_9BACL